MKKKKLYQIKRLAIFLPRKMKEVIKNIRKLPEPVILKIRGFTSQFHTPKIWYYFILILMTPSCNSSLGFMLFLIFFSWFCFPFLALQSALFNFHSFLTVVLLVISTCTFLKMQFPSILQQKTGYVMYHYSIHIQFIHVYAFGFWLWGIATSI